MREHLLTEKSEPRRHHKHRNVYDVITKIGPSPSSKTSKCRHHQKHRNLAVITNIGTCTTSPTTNSRTRHHHDVLDDGTYTKPTTRSSTRSATGLWRTSRRDEATVRQRPTADVCASEGRRERHIVKNTRWCSMTKGWGSPVPSEFFVLSFHLFITIRRWLHG